MDIKELAAREEIRELVASYNHFGDTGIMDSLFGLFVSAKLHNHPGVPRFFVF